MKQAYFILGPESSGTRMITKAFISSGCYGDFKHKQRLDDLNFKATPDKIVFRRSLPHGTKWPAIADTITLMRRSGYQVRPILILRDKDATAASQLRHAHERDGEEAKTNIAFSVDYTYKELTKVKMVPLVICYEPFVRYPEVRELFFKRLGLPVPQMEFFDANEKYQGQEV